MNDFLFTDDGRRYLQSEYVSKERSTYSIAEERGTYPNLVRRALLHHKFEVRGRGPAQAAALKTGRQSIPTKGRVRTPEERANIGDGVAGHWGEMTAAERSRRADLARAQWEAMPEHVRQEMRTKAAEGIRKAADDGSRLERDLLVKLQAHGHAVRLHAEFLVSAEQMHVDLLLPELRVAIEVDGPSHHLPIWGDEQLAKTVAADLKKNGLLAQAGFVVVRVKCLKKTVSDHKVRELTKALLAAVEGVRVSFPPVEKRLIQLEVK